MIPYNNSPMVDLRASLLFSPPTKKKIRGPLSLLISHVLNSGIYGTQFCDFVCTISHGQ